MITVAVVTVMSPLFEKTLRTPLGGCNTGGRFCLIYYIVQVLAILPAGFYIPAVDIIYIGSCISLAMQFKILSYLLKNIDHTKTSNREDEMEAIGKIKELVYHNNLLIR